MPIRELRASAPINLVQAFADMVTTPEFVDSRNLCPLFGHCGHKEAKAPDWVRPLTTRSGPNQIALGGELAYREPGALVVICRPAQLWTLSGRRAVQFAATGSV